MFYISSTCPDCNGKGKRHTNPCPDCHGSGLQLETKELKVKVPAGFDDGMQLRYSGHGEPGTLGGPPGDLYIRIRVRQHEVIQRENEHLYMELDVSMVKRRSARISLLMASKERKQRRFQPELSPTMSSLLSVKGYRIFEVMVAAIYI